MISGVRNAAIQVYDAYSQYFQFAKTRTNYCANSPDGVIMIAENNFYYIDIFVSRTKTKRNNPEKQTEQRLKQQYEFPLAS